LGAVQKGVGASQKQVMANNVFTLSGQILIWQRTQLRRQQ